MAALNELIQKIENQELRAQIQAAADRLVKQKKFGLVFEEHLPECTPLYDIPVKKGAKVALKAGKVSDYYTVLRIEDGIASCLHQDRRNTSEFAVEDLVCVAEFGEPIYPYLKPLDFVCNAPDSDLWHTLIEADNYHALQLLEYLYAGQVDCIYIDPPYNKPDAKDWKYNNNYVDSNDQYRHSKWLSMMQKRLKLAKKLLNSKDSVLIVTIDEKEYLHLGCLLEEVFPEARIQMVSTAINPAVVSRAGEFGRCGEFIFFVMIGSASPQKIKLSREWVSSRGRTHTGNVRWDLLQRSGTNARREDRPNLFYPIYINETSKKVAHVGNPIPKDADRKDVEQIEGTQIIWPIRSNGSEGNWQWGNTSFIARLKQGRVRIGGDAKKGFTVYILKDGEYNKIIKGDFEVIGRGINNEYIVESNDTNYVTAIPGDIWKITAHDSTQYGSRLLSNIFQNNRFPFPKSLYAVFDVIQFFTSHKQNALIVDFFAGSGTTLHAVNLLNAVDGGQRRCIMVTNNEVSDSEANRLSSLGFSPGDEEWEKIGIARYVTWPRTLCSIKGHNVDGSPLKGKYGVDIERYFADANNPKIYRKAMIPAYPELAEMRVNAGMKANAAFFKLGFLDKTKVSLGRQFKEMLPTLWMKAGAFGPCPCLSDGNPAMLILPKNRMAILNDEDCFGEFIELLARQPEIKTVFLVTDYEASFRAMSTALEGRQTYQLYRDYLDNFCINTGRNAQ